MRLLLITGNKFDYSDHAHTVKQQDSDNYSKSHTGLARRQNLVEDDPARPSLVCLERLPIYVIPSRINVGKSSVKTDSTSKFSLFADIACSLCNGSGRSMKLKIQSDVFLMQ